MFFDDICAPQAKILKNWFANTTFLLFSALQKVKFCFELEFSV